MNDKLQSLLEQVGAEIQNEEAVVKYNAAKKAYIEDVEITSAVSEYNVQRFVLLL